MPVVMVKLRQHARAGRYSVLLHKKRVLWDSTESAQCENMVPQDVAESLLSETIPVDGLRERRFEVVAEPPEQKGK